MSEMHGARPSGSFSADLMTLAISFHACGCHQ